jgi:cytochrome P450
MLDQFQGAHSYAPEIIECPWAFDAALRAEAPVYYDDVNDIYVVSSYELVREVLTDPERFSSRYMEKFVSKDPFPEEVAAIYAEGYPKVDALLVTDGDVHDRHRSIVNKAFSRKRLEELAPMFEARIKALLDEALPQGRMKFRHDFAHPLPIVMMQEQLRIPDEDLPKAMEWSEIISSNNGGREKSLEQHKHEAREMIGFQKYFEKKLRGEMELIEKTGSGARDDDILALLAGAVLDPADPMDMAEAMSYMFALFPATHDTTTASLTACMQRYVSSKQAQEMIAANPDSIKKLVDEAMRHESPVRAFWRRAAIDTTLDDVDIPVGAYLLLRISAANRDDAVFPDAAKFDPERRMTQAYLTFGTGIHTCAGRAFARHIIISALKQLTERAENFRFAEGANDFSHVESVVLPYYNEIEIEFDGKNAAGGSQWSR